MNSELPEANLQLLFSLHREEAQVRQKTLTTFSFVALLALIIVTSLVLGNKRAIEERSQITSAEVQLTELMRKNSGIKLLTMKQFESLSEVSKTAEELITLLEKDFQVDYFGKFEQFDREGVLKGSNLKPSTVLTDLERMKNMNNKYAALTWSEFKMIPEKQQEILIVRIPIPAPRDELNSFLERYGLLEGVKLPSEPNTPMKQILSHCLSTVMSIYLKNSAILDHLAKLLNWDKKALSLSVSVFQHSTDSVRNSYQRLVSILGVSEPKLKFYLTNQSGKPLPEETTFDIVYARILQLAKDRVTELEKGLTASIYGISIKFPVTPIVLLVPLTIPLYALAVRSLRRRRKYHLEAAASIEKSIFPSKEHSRVIRAIRYAKPTSKTSLKLIYEDMLRWVDDPSNLQFLVNQIFVATAYLYLFFVAIQLIFLLFLQKGVGTHPLSFAFGIVYLLFVIVLHVVMIFFNWSHRKPED